jgi:hypothetical protein
VSSPQHQQSPNNVGDGIEKLAAIVGGLISIVTPFLNHWLDVSIIASLCVIVVGISMLFGALYHYTRNMGASKRRIARWVGFAACLGGGLVSSYFAWSFAQPRFEITALHTLDGDPDTYELTDLLIWNQDRLDTVGLTTTLQIEIRPRYQGIEHQGKVIALLTSPDGKERISKPLWDDFTSASNSLVINLSLAEVLKLSGLKANGLAPINAPQPTTFAFAESQINVTIARESDKLHPWPGQKTITIRNAPWEIRSRLVYRNQHNTLDVIVHNLGGPSKFQVKYKLVRLGDDHGIDADVMSSGITSIDLQPPTSEARLLHTGESFTETLMLPTNLSSGRYVVEAVPVKEQAYIQFTDPTVTWSNIQDKGPWWWFCGYFERQTFNVPQQAIALDPTIAAEHQRMGDQGINLGFANNPAEDVISANGTAGKRQIFQNGEIYSYNGKAFALYGPILDHYHQRGGYEQKNFGFPTTGIESVTSSSGVIATMMKFEGYDNHGNAAIFTSDKGTAAVWGKIGATYFAQEGGPTGWLGIPLADEQYYPESTTELFEQGYIVYLTPMVGNERDWSHAPVGYPYLASKGTLLDISASEGWKQTSLTLQAGDTVTITQVDGWWSILPDGRHLDANGDPTIALQAGNPAPERPIGSLIARLGGKTILPVRRSAILTADAEGTLELAINDNTPADNQGHIMIQLMVKKAAP